MSNDTVTQLKIKTLRVLNYSLIVISQLLCLLTPAFFVLLIFSVIALLPITDQIIPPLLLTALFWAALIYSFAFGLKRTRWPRMGEADRRLENANNYHDRPIQLFYDALANPSPDGLVIWSRFKNNLHKRLLSMRLPRLFYFSADKDPYALRLLPILAFVIIFFSYEPSSSVGKLKAMAIPHFDGLSISDRARIPPVTIQITPPDYTHQAVRVLKGSGHSAEPLLIAENSILRFTIRSKWIAPTLLINDQEYPLVASDQDQSGDDSSAQDEFYVYEHNVGSALSSNELSTVKIKRSILPLLSVPYILIEDTPPKLEISDDITTSNNGTISLKATIDDDYGVENLDIFMDLPADYTGDVPLGNAYQEQRSFLYDAGPHKDITIPLNLTAHPYAGMDVNISMHLVDGAGHFSERVTLPITLPEREFTDENAKRIIALRKFIITEQLAYRNYIYQSLAEMSLTPDIIGSDAVIKLALTIARERMMRAPNIQTLYDLIDILWRVALRLDKGEFLQAQQDLQETINALNQILSDPNASQDQKLKAMNDLKNALAAYFQEAQAQAMRQAQGDDTNLMSQSQIPTPNSNALADFLSQLEDMALNDPAKAKELLQDLENALNNLNNNMQATLPEDIEKMMQFMEEMDAIIEAQRNLLDKSRLHQDYLDHFARKEAAEKGKDKDGDAQDENNDAISSQQAVTDLESFFKSFNLPPPDIHNNPGFENSEKLGKEDKPILSAPTMDVILEANTQRHIQDLLHNMTENMSVIPDELATADTHMGNSATFLEYERLAKSIIEQEKILEALNKKREQMQQAFEERLKHYAQQSGMKFSMDPLGRKHGDNGLTRSLSQEEYDLPKNGQQNQIDEILRQLRERAGDFDLPKSEREYYKRLLHQW